MKRIGFYLIMIIGMMLCWGCGDHKITESTETEAGLPEYKMAQLDMAQICEFGKVQDEYVCIGEADNGGYIRLTGKSRMEISGRKNLRLILLWMKQI